jgi:hypothetical protein
LGTASQSERRARFNYTGYDFWLTKLNQFNGNYINAEMGFASKVGEADD